MWHDGGVKFLSHFLICFLLLFLGSKSGWAAEPAKTTTAALGSYEVFLSSGFLGISKGSSQYDLSPGVQKQIWLSWLQLGGEVTYQKIAYRGGGSTNMLILAGPTANYDGYFLSLGVALKSGSTDQVDSASDDPNGFGFHFLVGKRIPLGSGWSFRPSLGVVSTGSTGMVFRPFALSYSF